jgi:hypothetical protein
MYSEKLSIFGKFIHIILLFTLLTLPHAVLADDVQPPAGGVGPVKADSYPAPELIKPPSESAMVLQALDSIPDPIITDPLLDMKVLVLLDTTETGAVGLHQGILGYLDILGIPYDVIDGADRQSGVPLFTESDLWDGINHGYYYAVLISTSNVWSEFSPLGIDASEKAILKAYGLNFDIRFVTWYGYPSAGDYGLDFVGALPYPTDVSMTTTGQQVFNYLKPAATLYFTGTYGLLATPAAGADVTSLWETAGGDTVLAVFQPTDSGEHMLFTVSGYYPAIPASDPLSPSHIHAQLLPYGMINWATKGVFIGERHVYFAPQPDDVLAWGDRWDAVQHQTIYDFGFRLEASDIDNIITWMTTFRSTEPNAGDFMIEMPFNGEGMLEDEDPVGSGIYPPGTLTNKVIAVEDQFTWLNHTYTHRDLTGVNYSTAYGEINDNNLAAIELGLTDYVTTTLLTGAYSGLDNTDVISAAYDLGIRHLLVNASAPGYDNPTPNTGIPHPYQPEILQQPRNANNVFYFSTTDEEEADYYNWLYCPGYQSNPIPSNRCWDYATIISLITSQALMELLDFNVNPTMFHMNNLNDYGSGNTLLADFIESLYGKFNAYYNTNVPILSLRTQEIGALMQTRMDFNASGASGILACGNNITLTTTQTATVPLTGVNYGGDTENYAGQNISYFSMGGPYTVTIPGIAASVPVSVANLQLIAQDNDIILNWDATTQDTDGQPLDALVYRIYRSTTPGFILSPTNMVGIVDTNVFTDTGAAVGPIYHYAVTSVGDNCWKHESEAARISSDPTSVSIINFTVDSNSISHLLHTTWHSLQVGLSGQTPFIMVVMTMILGTGAAILLSRKRR